MIRQFREIDPPDAVARKRQLDRIFFANEHLFGMTFWRKYQLFMRRCFAHWESPGQDAKLKASATRLRVERGRWLPGMIVGIDCSKIFQVPGNSARSSAPSTIKLCRPS